MCRAPGVAELPPGIAELYSARVGEEGSRVQLGDPRTPSACAWRLVWRNHRLGSPSCTRLGLVRKAAEHKTCVEGITVGRPTQSDYSEIKTLVTDLMLACESQNPGGLIRTLKALVPEWQPSEAYRTYLPEAKRNDVDSRRLAVAGE